MRIDPLRRRLAQISNVLVMLNSAVNFPVYCVFSRNFRSVLKAALAYIAKCVFTAETSTTHSDAANSTAAAASNTGDVTTLLSDSRPNETAIRLTPTPCDAKLVEAENGKAIAGTPS